jgi:CxxC-x17-CxxC domain-containing protein
MGIRRLSPRGTGRRPSRTIRVTHLRSEDPPERLQRNRFQWIGISSRHTRCLQYAAIPLPDCPRSEVQLFVRGGANWLQHPRLLYSDFAWGGHWPSPGGTAVWRVSSESQGNARFDRRQPGCGAVAKPLHRRADHQRHSRGHRPLRPRRGQRHLRTGPRPETTTWVQIPARTISFSISKDSVYTNHKLHCTSSKRRPMAGDISLTCSDCGQDFTFTAADQAFFQERGYSTPKRCKNCRQAKKNDQGGSGYRSAPAQGTPVICSGCGQPTTVPFEPRGDRPVFCRDCYQARKGSGGGGASARGRSR